MSEPMLNAEMPEEAVVLPKEGNQVSLGQKISWSVGAVTEQLITNGIGVLAMPIYTIALSINPALLGWALAVPRFFDAIVDPFIGNVSDNTRSRWGRRQPYIFTGTILCAIFFILLWIPPVSYGKTAIFWYFMVVSVLYYIAYAIFAIPRYALGYELSSDYNERTTIMAWNSLIASATVMATPWLYKMCFLPIFTGQKVGEVLEASVKPEIIGVRYVAVIVGIVILISGLAPVFTCKEKTHMKSQEKTNFLEGLKITVTNRPFLLMVGIGFFMTIGIAVAGTMNLFINIYYVCGGSKESGALYAGYAGTVQGITSLVACPLVAIVARKIGKKATLMSGLVLAMIGYFSGWFMFTPAHPMWQIVPIMLIAPGFACYYVLNGSILADICDLDELSTGKRREGMFGSMAAFLGKSVGAAVTIVAGYILLWAGYIEGQPLTPQTITNMRILFAFVPVGLLVISFLLAALFPITAKSAYEVRVKLERRKQAAMGNAAEV